MLPRGSGVIAKRIWNMNHIHTDVTNDGRGVTILVKTATDDDERQGYSQKDNSVVGCLYLVVLY